MPYVFTQVPHIAADPDVQVHLRAYRDTGATRTAEVLIAAILKRYRQRPSRATERHKSRTALLKGASMARGVAMAHAVAVRADVAQALELFRFTATVEAEVSLIQAVLAAYRDEARRPDCESPMARSGEHHGRSRLRVEDVRAIRAWAAPYVQNNLPAPWVAKAREFQVSEGSLRDIAFGRTWTHV